MMVAQKPVVYPKLTDSMLAVVDAYEETHGTVTTHAQEHRRTLESRRSALALQRSAKKLVETDTK